MLSLRHHRPPLSSSSFVSYALRTHTSTSSTPPIKLVAELRKLTDVPISKARQALASTNNDLTAALQWIQDDLAASGAKRAAKVAGRVAGEGVIASCILSPGGAFSQQGRRGVRAAMIELNCETDFVGRNELFSRLAADIAHTTAFISEATDVSGKGSMFKTCSLDVLKDAPLLSQSSPQTTLPSGTVGSSIRDLISKVGENITLRRAVAVVEPPPSRSAEGIALRLASYVHGGTAVPSQGRIGALALLALKSSHLSSLFLEEKFRTDLERIERSIARQIVGFATTSVQPSEENPGDESALYSQPFMMLAGEGNGRPVGDVLREWAIKNGVAESDEEGGLAVLGFEKWTLGEVLEKS